MHHQPNPQSDPPSNPQTQPELDTPTLINLLESRAAPLLQDCTAQIHDIAATPEEEIQVLELLVMLADLQAGRAEAAGACVRRLFPQHGNTASAVYHGIAVPMLHSLQAQAASSSVMASGYRARLLQLQRDYRANHNPAQATPANALPPPAYALPFDALHAYDHFAYPLGALLQALPGEITNVGSLSLEERQMCSSVAALAYQAQETLMDGMAALGNLISASSDKAEATTLKHAGALLGWLTNEVRFMTQCAAEYGAAAMHGRKQTM